MTARELFLALERHMQIGQHLDDPVLIRMDGTVMTVEHTFEDGVLVLVAGTAI